MATAKLSRKRSPAMHTTWPSFTRTNLVRRFARKLLFRQRLYLISGQPAAPEVTKAMPLAQIASLPLILPGHQTAGVGLIDRAFAAAGVLPNIIAEADALSSELSAVRNGVGSTMLPIGDPSIFARGGFAEPVPVEPALYLSCSVVSSSDFPLTYAGEAVSKVLAGFVIDHLRRIGALGVSGRRIERSSQRPHPARELLFGWGVLNPAQLSENASTPDQFVMTALLGNNAVFQHNDLVGVPNRTQAVSDHDDGCGPSSGAPAPRSPSAPTPDRVPRSARRGS